MPVKPRLARIALDPRLLVSREVGVRARGARGAALLCALVVVAGAGGVVVGPCVALGGSLRHLWDLRDLRAPRCAPGRTSTYTCIRSRARSRTRRHSLLLRSPRGRHQSQAGRLGLNLFLFIYYYNCCSCEIV